MKCETCEQAFQDTAVKVYRGKKVCPSCFHTLTTSGVPKQNQHLQIIQTQHIQTTVCPECSAELHVDSRKCPRCGAIVQRADRLVHAAGAGLRRLWVRLWLVLYAALGLLGLACAIGSVGLAIEKQEVLHVLIGIPFGAIAMALSIWGLVRTSRGQTK